MLEAFFPGEAQDFIDRIDDPDWKAAAYDQLCSARPRLDCACMLMERIEWARGRWSVAKYPRRSIHPTIDSSPTSGRDMFGCVLEVWTSDCACETVVLPGSTLGHGYTSAVDKVFLSSNCFRTNLETFPKLNIVKD